ncbi:hypothetical protein PHLGIDRAFT_114828 [Phlebiopsis gigantea 11061_1 CR5-6]|uniref:UDENN domain-containing protein n=1 Tax=Phlebiopsis gigantea (strain 11061_1 CR5-6) TaxID=745531 RepID=A0A0C3PU46_PHLG1|nr:hypothetical protein PHLGIDRAFT_114828 [Phlebiopsis gigantea 11061_1 CR5-6]
MSEEGDIGLYNLARKSSSSYDTPRKRNPRRLSIVSVLHEEAKTPVKSPSNPSLVPSSPKITKALSRSNSLPRLSRTESVSGSRSDDLQSFAFSSFPDSPQLDSGSYIHSYRIRQPSSLAQSDDAHERYCSQDGFIYGFSHFTQRRDSTSKRGYQQRSVVILTQHPYPSLFYSIMSYLGRSFLSHGGPMLEVACHNIANWSDPQLGAALELGFLGYVFTVELPTSLDAQQSSKALRSPEKYDPESHASLVEILASLSPQDPPIIDPFEAAISHIWSIWECILLCEPVLVFGPSAAVTSQVIWWLRDLLRPIPLTGDFRPFFTIHDVDNVTLLNARQPQAGLLLGVTNPFFEKKCSHWPHILSLGSPKRQIIHTTSNVILAANSDVYRKGKTSSHALEISVGPSPGWTTKTHKRYISKDQALLKKLEDSFRGDEHSRQRASEALREHLTSRTAAFLMPLQRYLNTLIPTFADRTAPTTPNLSTHDVSTAPHPTLLPPTTHRPLNQLTVSVATPALPLRLKPFSESSFFASLKVNGSPLPFKSTAKRKEFYERWLRTRAFGIWLAAQEEVVDKVLATPFPSAVSVKSSLGS